MHDNNFISCASKYREQISQSIYNLTLWRFRVTFSCRRNNIMDSGFLHIISINAPDLGENACWTQNATFDFLSGSCLKYFLL